MPVDVTALLERSRDLLQQPVLVTGGTGFVGANLVRTLVQSGARVHLAVQPSSSTWRLDDVRHRIALHVAALTERDELARTFDAVRPGVVLHLATPRGDHGNVRARFVEVIVLGTAHLLRLCREFEVRRIVVTGSSLEYAPMTSPIAEDAPIEPMTVHGIAKAAAALLCQQAARDSRLPVAVLRLFHVYGPWESRHRLLPTAIRAAIDGTDLPLTEGGCVRDWVFVGDVVDAIVRAIGSDAVGEIINVGSGRAYSNEAVAACVAASLGRPLRIESGGFPIRAGETRHRLANRGKAETLLGWRPRFTLEAGIAETIQWFKMHPSAWSMAEDVRPGVV